MASEADYDRVAAETHETVLKWRLLRAPKRGEIVGQIGEELRANREEFGALVTLEMGMTITAVRGHGRQKGHKEVYRGIPGGPAAKGEGGDGGRR
jgi:acyl-CoA reductase-like NAD-dependent aldehyde dehydrogenase